MPPPRDPRLHADDILQAIANIEADTARVAFEGFVADRRVRQLVERNLEIISEASRRIPDHLKATEPDVPWREIAGIGNILRHDYGAVQPETLWPHAPPRRPEGGRRAYSGTPRRVTPPPGTGRRNLQDTLNETLCLFSSWHLSLCANTL